MFRFKRSGDGYVPFHRSSGCLLGFVRRIRETRNGIPTGGRYWVAFAPPLRQLCDDAGRAVASRLAARAIGAAPWTFGPSTDPIPCGAMRVTPNADGSWPPLWVR